MEQALLAKAQKQAEEWVIAVEAKDWVGVEDMVAGAEVDFSAECSIRRKKEQNY